MTAPDPSAFKARILEFASAGCFSDPVSEDAAVESLLSACPLEILFGFVTSANEPELQAAVLTAIARVLMAPRGSEVSDSAATEP